MEAVSSRAVSQGTMYWVKASSGHSLFLRALNSWLWMWRNDREPCIQRQSSNESADQERLEPGAGAVDEALLRPGELQN
jgi:hypothetical protein